jgi:hypothetical protein
METAHKTLHLDKRSLVKVIDMRQTCILILILLYKSFKNCSDDKF